MTAHKEKPDYGIARCPYCGADLEPEQPASTGHPIICSQCGAGFNIPVIEQRELDSNKGHVRCSSCGTELELNQSEAESQRFICPKCHQLTDLQKTTRELVAKMVELGKIPLSAWDWFDIWFYPLSFIFLAVFFSIRAGPRLFYIPIPFWLWGLFQGYRAFISPKLTFIPSVESVARKKEIVCVLQKMRGWELGFVQDGYFVFSDTNAFSPREIVFICAEQGYYFNCWVHAFRAGSGVSIIQTKRIAEAIEELSTSGISTQVGRLTSGSS